jgi:hypothetical protein
MAIGVGETPRFRVTRRRPPADAGVKLVLVEADLSTGESLPWQLPLPAPAEDRLGTDPEPLGDLARSEETTHVF